MSAGSIVASYVEKELATKSAVTAMDVKAHLRSQGISVSDDEFEDAVKILKGKGIVLDSLGSEPRSQFVLKT